MTAKDLFEVKVPALLRERPAVVRGIGAVFHFKVVPDGTWTVDLKSATPSCHPGLNGTPDCTLEIAASDFDSLLASPSSAMSLFMSGRLKVTGNQMLATKLGALFS